MRSFIRTTLVIGFVLLVNRPGFADIPAIVPPSEHITWGPTAQGLRCGLQIEAPAPNRMTQRVYLTIGNVSRSSIAIYNDKFRDAAKGFAAFLPHGEQMQTGKKFVDQDEVTIINGPRQSTTIPAGGSTTRNYLIFLGEDASGSYRLTFQGNFPPVGVEAANPLRCGPLSFRV